VDVSEEHLHNLMTGDEGHFTNGEPHLQEPADGFMAWVMEAEVVETSAAPISEPPLYPSFVLTS